MDTAQILICPALVATTKWAIAVPLSNWSNGIPPPYSSPLIISTFVSVSVKCVKYKYGH